MFQVVKLENKEFVELVKTHINKLQETHDEFIKRVSAKGYNLNSSNIQAFQIAGNDNLGGNKLITVVKNNETNTTTMYTCDSKQCYPVALDGNIDMEKLDFVNANIEDVKIDINHPLKSLDANHGEIDFEEIKRNTTQGASSKNPFLDKILEEPVESDFLQEENKEQIEDKKDKKFKI